MTTHPKRPLGRAHPTFASYERPAGMEELAAKYRAIPRVPHQGQPRPGAGEPVRPEGAQVWVGGAEGKEA